MSTEASPRPWRVMRYTAEDEPDRIIDANGDEVAIELLEADAQLIIDAVNERAKFEEARMEFPDLRPVIIAAGQRDAAVAERDRLRDLVRRLCDELESHYYEPQSMDDRSVIREARAAIGEDAK